MKQLALSLVLTLVIGLTACPTGTRKLAVASDAIAHALANAQTAAKQAAQQGVISATDEQEFETYLAKASQAGMLLNASIRQGESAATVSQKVNTFLDAFNSLQGNGVLGIKNPALQLSISIILIGAESSVAIITATLGGK